MSGRHAYVLPSECIKLYLANGNQPMLFDRDIVPSSYSSPNETPRGIDISSALSETKYISVHSEGKEHLRLSFLEWKDDCESSRSNKASITGSLWVWTMTLFEQEKTNDLPRATFPLVIGFKSDCHDTVEQIIAEDFQKMSSYSLPCVTNCVNSLDT